MKELIAGCYEPQSIESLEKGSLAESDLWKMAQRSEALSRFSYNLMTNPEYRILTVAQGDSRFNGGPVIQFWDSEIVPDDVGAAMRGWRENSHGTDYILFDNKSAMEFISEHYGQEFVKCYEFCHHPAMRSDYFRLAFLLARGGIYIDADDMILCSYSQFLSRLLRKFNVIPLVWDKVGQRTVPDSECKLENQFRLDWTYYFNNAPIATDSHNSIVAAAWHRANSRIQSAIQENRMASIHGDTGPENLTISILFSVLSGMARQEEKIDLAVLDNWSEICCTKYFEYKGDDRNWRSNRNFYVSAR